MNLGYDFQAINAQNYPTGRNRLIGNAGSVPEGGKI